MRVAFRAIPELVWMLRYPIQAAQDLIREVRDFFVRGWRGYARTDVWDLHFYLATWLPHALRQLRDGCSYPPSLTHDEWREKLALMIAGFRAADRVIDMDWDSVEEAKALVEQSKLGRAEFGEYFLDLWD